MKKLIIIFFLLTSICYGADDPSLISYPPNKIMGFRGLDTRSTAPTIADSRAEDLKNVKLSAKLDLRQRYGYDTVNDATLDDLDISSPAITGIFDSEYSGGESHIFAFVGTKIKYDNSGTWTEVGNYYVAPTITSGKNYQFDCELALDYSVCTNDRDVIIKLSSTPAKSALDVSDLSDTLTKAKTLIWYRNYLILGNTYENSTERPTRFRWSDVGTIETWQDDNFIDISTYGGDEIIAYAELYGELYIFLKKSIWKASLVGGDDVFQIRKVIDGIGAISTYSVQVAQLSDTRSVVFFLDERKKVMMFDGVIVTDIGALIQDTLSNLNESRLQYAVSSFDGESYYLCASTSGETENDAVYELQTEIFEWTKHTGIDANAMAQIKDSSSTLKTYFGNYDAFVYWLDNPDLKNDVDGATGIVDSTSTTDSATITGATIVIDSDITSGSYTGAVIRIVSGTGVGQEEPIIDYSATSVTVVNAFTTSLDSTSVYEIGGIDSYYDSKWYELGSATHEKSFLGMLFWAEEASSNEVTVSYAVDFGGNLGSETISLSPDSASLWDSAIWDDSVWSTTGNKIYTSKFKGFGNFIQVKFSNSDIDETYHLYGYNNLAIQGDIKQ